MSFYRKNKFLIWLFVLGLVVRLAMLAIVNPLPAFNFLDSQSYDQTGWQLAESWRGGPNLDIAGETNHIQVGYYYFVAGIYYLFGHHEIIVDAFNIFLGVFAAILLYFLTRELFSETAAKIAAALGMCWPSIMLWSTRNLKDALLLFLMAGIALFFIKLAKNFRHGHLAGLSILGAALLSMRAYAFLIFCGSLGLGYLFLGLKKMDKRAIFVGAFTALILAAAVIFMAQFKDLQWNYLSKINLNTLDFVRKSTVSGGSSFGQDVEYKSIADVAKFLPTGLAYSVFSPFPWQQGSDLFKIAVPETILWYLALIFVVWGIIIAWRKKKYEAWGLILFLILITVSFAVFQGNIGSLFRQRAQVWFFGFVFAGAGLVGFFSSKSECLKRFFDISVSFFGLIFLSPLFLITSLAILFEDGRPIFFISPRVGKGSQVFGMLKFRTMRKNRSNLFEYNQKEETRTGRWLRRFSLDELPQIFNIIRGEMSLVGPRPTFPFRMENSPPYWRKRLEVKPGLTGWQQINGRNSLDWDKIIELDNWYVDNWSFGLDLRIIFKTLNTVVTGRGLYTSPAVYQRVAKEWEDYKRNNN